MMTKSGEDKFEDGGIDFKLRLGDKTYGLHPVTSGNYSGHSVVYDGRTVVSMFEDETVRTTLETAVYDGDIGEKKTVVVKNKSSQPFKAELISYFEPVLQREADYSAHPGFSKLQLEYEDRDGAVMIHRRGDDGKPVISACFICDRDVKISTSRLKTYGRSDPFRTAPEKFEECFLSASPEGCVSMCVQLELDPGEETEVNYALSAGFDAEGVYDGAVKILNADK